MVICFFLLVFGIEVSPLQTEFSSEMRPQGTQNLGVAKGSVLAFAGFSMLESLCAT